jgi:ligand-binding sensor domain-containing protein/serine phosphatase RsbU (regulator of sigma subunit)
MWFGTDGGGVCRFNGTGFHYFDKSNGLSGNIVRTLFEDSRGNIWIGTENGLDRYDGIDIEQMAAHLIIETPVMTVNEDSQGNIWVGTLSKGLILLEDGDDQMVRQFNQDDGLLSLLVFDIDIDRYGRLWLSMVGGITIFEYRDGQVETTKLIEYQDLPHNIIISGSIDPDGILWFGSAGSGVIRIMNAESLEEIEISQPDYLSFLNQDRIWDICWMKDGSGMIATDNFGVVSIDHDSISGVLNKANGLKTNQVVGITEDQQGGRWFSTMGNGMLRYTNKLFTRYDASGALVDNQVSAICAGEADQFYVGTDEGLTLFRFENDRLLKLEHYNTQSGLLDNKINAIYYREGRLWIGSARGVNLLEKGVISPVPFNSELKNPKVNALLEDDAGNLWIGTDDGYNLYRKGKLHGMSEDDGFVHSEVQSILQDREGEIWMATLGGLVRLQGDQYTDYDAEDGLGEIRINTLAEDARGNIWIGTFGGGIFMFDREADSLPISRVDGANKLSSKIIYSLGFLNGSVLVAGTESGLAHIITGDRGEIGNVYQFGVKDGYTGAKNSPNTLLIDGMAGTVFLGTSQGLVRYMPSDLPALISQPNVSITDLKMFFEEQEWSERGEVASWTGMPVDLVLPYDENHLTFSWVSAYYGDASDIEYTYFLDGQSRDWSPYSQGREVVFSGLPPGKYTLSVKVRNNYNISGNTSEFSFEIIPPFWKKPGFIIAALLLIFILVYLAIRLRLRSLEKEKVKLERTVDERTREVVEQKEQVQRQHNILRKQNSEIESSIHYAERIQKAVIPSNQILAETFADSFIMLLPQSIVSGDYYWIGEQGDYVIIVAADCTGHGVPGALMSMMGIGFLNQIVNEEKEVMPALILNKLREHIIASFTRGEEDKSDTKDGMDVALCSFNRKTRKMYYAGAYNPLYLIRHEGETPELITYEADRMPVGLHDCMPAFASQEVDYRKGDRIYMFSDGFPDQFGGPKYKKFLKKNFREMLMKNSHQSMDEQQRRYRSILDDWISHMHPTGDPIQQTDDILVMGVEL